MKITLSQLRKLIRETVEQVVQTNEDDLAEDEFTYAIAKAAEKGEKTADVGGKSFPSRCLRKKRSRSSRSSRNYSKLIGVIIPHA